MEMILRAFNEDLLGIIMTLHMLCVRHQDKKQAIFIQKQRQLLGEKDLIENSRVTTTSKLLASAQFPKYINVLPMISQ